MIPVTQMCQENSTLHGANIVAVNFPAAERASAHDLRAQAILAVGQYSKLLKHAKAIIERRILRGLGFSSHLSPLLDTLCPPPPRYRAAPRSRADSPTAMLQGPILMSQIRQTRPCSPRRLSLPKCYTPSQARSSRGRWN